MHLSHHQILLSKLRRTQLMTKRGRKEKRKWYSEIWPSTATEQENYTYRTNEMVETATEVRWQGVTQHLAENQGTDVLAWCIWNNFGLFPVDYQILVSCSDPHGNLLWILNLGFNWIRLHGMAWPSLQLSCYIHVIAVNGTLWILVCSRPTWSWFSVRIQSQ